MERGLTLSLTSSHLARCLVTIMLGLSQLYDLSQMKGYTTVLPTPKMEHVSTSRHKDSGKMIDSAFFFYVRILILIPLHIPIIPFLSSTCHRRHEQEKKRAYDQRILKRSGTWMFLPSHLFSVWWYGTCCQSCVQEA